jgi:hypothetical protein
MEPISAPAGVSAQQNEGFQKFYRAVVSPNHVRVTAGGRIVPNTRGPPSPTMRRLRDRGPMNGPPIPFGPGGPMGAFGPYPMPQVMPPYFPGFAPAPSPLMPMTYGFPMPAVPVMHPSAISSPGLHSQASGTSTLRDTINTRIGDARPEQAMSEAENDKPSGQPANSSGQGKPFQANGQCLGSMPPSIYPHFGGPFLPLNMMASPNFPLSPMPGAMMPPTQAGIGPMVPQMGHPPMHGISPLASPAFPPPGTFPGPVAPPVSSIKPSEITRNQLQQLRSSLKYSQDQLQFNRHQIDEKFMEQKIKDLLEQTQRFESLLRVQVAHEEAYYPKGDRAEKIPQAPSSLDIAASAPPDTELPDSGTANDSSPAPQQPPKHAAASYKPELLRPRNDFGLNAGTGKGGEVTFKYDPNDSNDFGDPIKKSGLSRAAALAPVFNPGSSSLSGSLFDGSQSHSTGASNSAAAARQVVDAWIGASASASATQPAPSVTTGSSGGSAEEEPETLGIPYLVGTLPAHLNARTAVDTDYNYPRPLTEDELRARFLYWGKAPRSARRGLPKYDGKHFYPASPMQQSLKSMAAARIERQSSSSSAAIQVRSTDHVGLRYPRSAQSLPHPRSRSDEPETALASALVHDGSAVRRFRSFRSQVDSSSDDMPHAIEAASAFDEVQIKSAGTSETETAAEKKSDKYGSKLWHAMLKKIPSSIAMSAATAQGSRSQITGPGASSLSPVTANAVMSSPPRSGSPTKVAELSGGGGALLTPIPEAGDENRPPRGPGTLEEHFRALAVNSGKRRSDLSPSWK